MKTGRLTIFMLAAMPIAGMAASGNFLDYRDYLLAGTPQAAVIVDVNHDGIPDAVVGTFAGTAILLGRGDGTLARPKMVGSSAVFHFQEDVVVDKFSYREAGGWEVYFGVVGISAIAEDLDAVPPCGRVVARGA